MHIEAIRLQNLRTFVDARIAFADPDDSAGRPTGNVHVLLGGNSAGKSTVLRAIAASVLAPVLERAAGLTGHRWLRRSPAGSGDTAPPADDIARVETGVRLHRQDLLGREWLPLHMQVERMGDLELIDWLRPDDASLARELRQVQQVRDASAFFLVAYGASRWVDLQQQVPRVGALPLPQQRWHRVASLFDNRGLVPLAGWLPAYAAQNPGRYRQVVNLMNRLLPQGCRMIDPPRPASVEAADMFEMEGVALPFRGLSDGYQAYVGWVGDMLYQLCQGARSGRKLVDSHGVVLVDEIDLHLHPAWQRALLPTLATALPAIQFIVTTHSPLVLGALQPGNVAVLEPDRVRGTRIVRLAERVHGQSADQLLLSPYFGLDSTRPADVSDALEGLRRAGEAGDPAASAAYLRLLSCGEGGP